MKKIFSIKKPTLALSTLSSSLLLTGMLGTQPTFAEEYPAYQENTAYNAGVVVHHQGTLYQCKIAGWCGGPGSAYKPGEGHYWTEAWDLFVEIEVSASTSGYPLYKLGKSYQQGDIVEIEEVLYRCLYTDWCSSSHHSFTPKEVYAWEIVTAETIEQTTNNAGGTSQPTEPTTPVVEPAEPSTPTAKPTSPEETGQGETSPEGNYVLAISEINAKEKALTSFPEMEQVRHAIATRSEAVVERITPNHPDNPENVKRVESIIDTAKWEHFFPDRSPEYTYENLLKAVGKFSAFCATYTDGRDSDAICRKSLATIFAHFTQETGGHVSEAYRGIPEWRQGLVYLREVGWTEGAAGGYNSECNPAVWQGQTWPCGRLTAGGDYKSYFGRGAKQLSYNYNYGPFSQAIFGDIRVLLDNPEQVAESYLNLASAVFFFVYPQPPKPSMLHVIDGTWQPNGHDLAAGLEPGFGVTTQIINGGVECGGSVEVQQSVNRIDYYKNFARELGVAIAADEKLGCINMKQFASEGAGALNIYWEQDWSWTPHTPSGKTYSCQLVNYQTPHSAFTKGDYAKCVEAKYDDLEIDHTK